MSIQKILPLLKTKTLKDSTISFTGQMISSVLGLVFFGLALRFLGKSGFGLFSLAYTTAVILKDVVDPATNASLMRFLPALDSQKKQLKFIKTAFLFKLKYFLIITPVLLLGHHTFSWLIFKTYIPWAIPLIILTYLALSLGSFISGVLRARKQFLAESIFTFTQPLIRLLFFLSFLYLGVINPQTTLVLNLLAYIIVSTIGLYVVDPIFLSAKITSAIRQNYQHFIPSLIIANTAGTITNQLNLYITNYFASLSQVGVLSAVNRLFTPVPQFAGVLDSVLGSRFSSFGSIQSSSSYLKKSVGLSLLAGAALIIGALAFWPLLVLVFGPDLKEGVTIFYLMAFSYAIFLFQVPFSSQLLYFQGRSDVIAKISMIQFVITLVSTLFFIANYKLLGAGLAHLTITTSQAIMIIACAILLPSTNKPSEAP